jgi:hypothetical protein
MRCLFLSVMMLSVLTATAVTLDIERLPSPTFADREVSGDAVLPSNRLEDMLTFSLEMTFEATLSNNVQVAFGRDNRPDDGRLAAEETDFIIGWDCGEWFLRPQGLKENYTFAPASTSGCRTLSLFIRVNEAGVPKLIVFKDGDTVFTFEGLMLSPFPDWLKPDLWTHLRVTVRGADIASENVAVIFGRDGAVIFIR